MSDNNQLPLETPVSTTTINRGASAHQPTPMMPPRMPQPQRPKQDREISFGWVVLGVVVLAVLGFCGFVLVKMGSPAVPSEVTQEIAV